jgi:hypothetical protein
MLGETGWLGPLPLSLRLSRYPAIVAGGIAALFVAPSFLARLPKSRNVVGIWPNDFG